MIAILHMSKEAVRKTAAPIVLSYAYERRHESEISTLLNMAAHLELGKHASDVRGIAPRLYQDMRALMAHLDMSYDSFLHILTEQDR